MATLSITVPDAAVTRVQEALGDALGLRNGSGQPRNATTQEVQGYIASHINAKVHAYEANKAMVTAAAAVVDVGAA